MRVNYYAGRHDTITLVLADSPPPRRYYELTRVYGIGWARERERARANGGTWNEEILPVRGQSLFVGTTQSERDMRTKACKKAWRDLEMQ